MPIPKLRLEDALEPYTFATVNAAFIRIIGFGNTENPWNSITEVCLFSTGAPLGERVDLIGAVPGTFTTDGGDFVLTVSPRDAADNLITDGVAIDRFEFVNVRAIRDDDPSQVIPADSADITDVIIENAVQGEPVTLVLDFDSSGSMSDNDPTRLRVAAGKRILQFLQLQDRVAVMDFGAGRSVGFRASRLLQDFTSDRSQLASAIDRVTASGGTPLFGSLLEALDLLDTQAPVNRGVVVLTDGEDTQSSSNARDVVDRANLLDNTPVCTIGLGSGVGIPPLQDIARETGCTFAQASNASALDRVFEQVTRGLLEGWVLVSGVGRFVPALTVGSYTISGVLRTDLDDLSADTPFRFPVEVSLVAPSITRRLEQMPLLPYTAAEEASGLFLNQRSGRRTK